MTTFLLHLIPQSLIYFGIVFMITAGLTLIIGGWATKFLPTTAVYQTPAEVIGVMLLLLGVYFYGGYDTEKTWSARLATDQKQWQSEEAARDLVAKQATDRAEAAEAAAKKATTQLNAQIKKDQAIIAAKQAAFDKQLAAVAPAAVKECPEVDPSIIEILNNAAAYPGGLQ